MNITKRVCCLYRVSTKKQVDKEKNDIPMQRGACHEFVNTKEGWEIVHEYEEKGISGYKVSASDRDAIQELKMAASRQEFDILLVFMFDRIGRIDDETPFVVEWFVKHGIEVWSTREGQQRFETHVDKLMNYLRFWQASGESEKTSMRIKTKMKQMSLEGFYTGGSVKYGYHLVDSGHINRKGHKIRKYEIDPEESEIVRMIDDMTIHKGYGSWRMADFLNKKGYRLHTGNKFTSTSVNRILRDTYYCGCLSDGSTSEALEKLIIRTPETYAQIQYILSQRAEKNDEKRQIAMSTKGKALLSGNVYCAHCGGRLTTIKYHDKYTRKDGSVYEVNEIKYCCYHKSRKLCQCDGQATYKAEIVDKKICQLIRTIFAGMAGAPQEDRLQQLLKRQTESNRAMQKKLKFQIKKNQIQLEKLQSEIGSALLGESLYSSEDLAQAINTLKSRISEDSTKLKELESEEKEKMQGIQSIIPAYRKFKSWADEFESATLEQKKMIACHLFNRVEVGKTDNRNDYRVSVEMNMTYQQFCKEWSTERQAVI